MNKKYDAVALFDAMYGNKCNLEWLGSLFEAIKLASKDDRPITVQQLAEIGEFLTETLGPCDSEIKEVEAAIEADNKRKGLDA
ncbi:hypothetical protein [Snodgrassella sp. CFCC 13594]|uniref:hypothetical protein n=1 Tax=Snodgrassella sp. CFCC 13594 TaxID=1775559 RepID=UPI0008305C83|nr:hypothetical protein [Snodgrassella sp. CFCC 13594]